MTFIDILNDIRKKAYSEQDKGQRFERLMRSYIDAHKYRINQGLKKG